MADTLQTITSGFYDSVDLDRLYSADQMCNPYKRVVTEGVFATPEGTASTDFQVLAADGLSVRVLPGMGLMGGKWTQNDGVVTFAVPANTSVYTRIDSVIARVDTNTDVRAASVIYRTGTATSAPTAPALINDDHITEYRIANVAVSAGATEVTQANITDCRGTDECPWITGLIQQVDTGALFLQYNDAMGEEIDKLIAENEHYQEEQRASWQAFIESLTQDLDVSMSVITLHHTVITQAESAVIAIGITGYDSTTDILQVYINGQKLIEDVDYTITANAQIELAEPVDGGQVVEFQIYKSVVQGDISSIQTMIQEISDKVDAATQDSGWISLTAVHGTPRKALAVRAVGKHAELNGSVQGLSTVGQQIAYLPVGYRPARNRVYAAPIIQGDAVHTVKGLASITLLAGSGAISFTATNVDNIAATDILYLDTDYLI